METKQVIVMRTDLNMRKGKMAAQAAHASMGALLQYGRSQEDGTIILNLPEAAIEWLNESFTKICVGIDSEHALLALTARVKYADIPYKLIRDNGATEFGGIKTFTCLAVGPAEADVVDQFTKELKLL